MISFKVSYLKAQGMETTVVLRNMSLLHKGILVKSAKSHSIKKILMTEISPKILKIQTVAILSTNPYIPKINNQQLKGVVDLKKESRLLKIIPTILKKVQKIIFFKIIINTGVDILYFNRTNSYDFNLPLNL